MIETPVSSKDSLMNQRSNVLDFFNLDAEKTSVLQERIARFHIQELI